MASKEEPDQRGSLQHVLEPTEPSETTEPTENREPTPSNLERTTSAEPSKPTTTDSTDNPSTNLQTPAKPEADVGSDANTPQYTSTTTTIRRNANGSVSSVYSGNKIRHLKKEDGVPLWRKDIQFDFLKYVFEDDHKVFHKASDQTEGHTFADIYLDAMAQSSKCSKILKEKLLSDRPAAVNMAMVCLLVNVGRMNTTLNFFPEMRAQLRTYHSIPSLQLSQHQDPNAYKQLQDAPRLKSILKGATEDVEQPGTIEDIKAATIPRTNPVNLIFVLAQFAPKISEMHFDVPRDFFDLVMKEQLSSRSRATAFLWLMWWYLESDFTLEAALNNPYGHGRRSRNSDVSDLPLLCPQFDFLTEEQAALENVDTPEEIEFGEQKQQERNSILDGGMPPVYSGPKRPKKSYSSNPVFSVNSLSNDDGGSPTRDINSPSNTPGGLSGANRGRTKHLRSSIKPDGGSDSDETPLASPTRGGGDLGESTSSKPHNLKSKSSRFKDSPSNIRPKTVYSLNGDGPTGPNASNNTTSGSGGGGGGGSGSMPKRSRPQTHHQLALENYRKDRVNYILDRGLRAAQADATIHRARDDAILRAAKRILHLDAGYDSEEEAHMTAAGRVGAAKMGVVMGGYARGAHEEDDFGEEMASVARGLRKLRRRVARAEGDVEALVGSGARGGKWRRGTKGRVASSAAAGGTASASAGAAGTGAAATASQDEDAMDVDEDEMDLDEPSALLRAEDDWSEGSN